MVVQIHRTLIDSISMAAIHRKVNAYLDFTNGAVVARLAQPIGTLSLAIGSDRGALLLGGLLKRRFLGMVVPWWQRSMTSRWGVWRGNIWWMGVSRW